MDFMEAGLPVILPISASNDPISASRCGIVTGSDEPKAIAAAISALVRASTVERTAMGERGREFVKIEYNYQRIATRYIDAILQSPKTVI
jgi:glycosyltransferase involved in cell wall biosynthesis